MVMIATAMAVAMMATQQHDGNATAKVMDGNGRCNGNSTVTTAIEGATATQRQHDDNGRRNRNGNKWSNGNVMLMIALPRIEVIRQK